MWTEGGVDGGEALIQEPDTPQALATRMTCLVHGMLVIYNQILNQK